MQLANLLHFNLLQARLGCILLFHCWPIDKTFHLAQQMPHTYKQFVRLKDEQLADWQDLEWRFLRHEQPTLAIYVALGCASAKTLLQQASREELFNQHYHWLLHEGDSTSNSSDFYDFFAPFNLSVNADVTYIVQTEQASGNADGVGNGDGLDTLSFALYDVYNNGKHIGGGLNLTADRRISCNRSSCHTAGYLSTLYLRSRYGNRASLTDVLFRVSTVVTQRPISWPPEDLLRFLNQNNETHIDGIARFGFRLLHILQDLLQCNMQFQFTDRWSTDDTNGGSVGAVVAKTADIGSAPSLATEGRLRYLSAIIETGYFRSICMFRTPHNAGIRGDVFLQPFSTLVWLIFAAMLVFTALLLWITFNLEQRRLQQRLLYVPSLLSTLLIAFGAACIQGSALIPRSTGGRVAYFALFLISFIMYNYYTSVVVSSLLSSPVKSKIKTLQQLAESSLTVGLEPLSFTKSYLNYSLRSEVHLFKKRKIEAQRNNPHLWLPAEEGVLRVLHNPGYVFVFEASSGYAYVEHYYTPQEICDLNEVLFRPEQQLYTHLHRNSTYKELVRLKLLRVLETGIYRKQRNYWVRTRLHCFAQNFVINVGMEYVAPLFFMLLCGYLLVMVLLLLEVSWRRYRPGH